MKFVPSDPIASSVGKTASALQHASCISPSRFCDKASPALPFHLALLESSVFSRQAILHADQQLQLSSQRFGAPPLSLPQSMMSNGHLSAELYYRLAAKRLGIGFINHIPDDVIDLPDQMPELANMAGIDWVLTKPHPRGEGFAHSPNRALIMAPEGETLDRLAQRLQDLPDLGKDLYLTLPARLQEGLRRARRQEVLDQHVYHLRDRLPGLSAHPVFPKIISFGIVIGLFCLVLASLLLPALALVINLCGIALFLAMAFLRFLAYRHARKGGRDPNVDRSRADLASFQNDMDWPSYAVLVPLFREGAIIPDLVKALMRMDYPHSRLTIYLVIEEVDKETQDAISRLSLPSIFQVVVVPDHGPRTKPKALNYALSFIKSDLTVIFDAEDRPAIGQLKEAALTMLSGNPRLACLQGRLAIDNGAEAWLSRQFSVEYSALFDGLLPFLSDQKLPIPLGGTSNHFRTDVLKEIGGWDPYNVTEDADLGLRLCRLGYEIGVIETDTQEEAPIHYNAWMKQRSRWFKGWMQTWLVHMRKPLALKSALGRSGFLAFQVMIGGMLISSLIHPAYLIGIGFSIWAISNSTGTDHPAFWLLLFTNSFNLLLGYGSAMLLGYVTASRRFGLGWGTIMQMPLYWLLMTPSAWRAFYQMLFNPHHWEKTPHGLSKGRPKL